MKLFQNLFLLTVVLSLSFISYKQILPRYFSKQHALTVDNLNLGGEYDNREERGVWWGKTAFSYKIAESEILPRVLGESAGPKRIEVDLTNQRLYAFEGDNKVFDFVISSGLYDWTPRGTFNIWIKVRYTKMEGGNQAFRTYYYLPNVPFVMFFSSSEIPRWKGFSLHGTYWHNDFGRPKSHGCVNMRTEDAEKLYYWALPDLKGKSSNSASADNPGTTIIIYGKYQG